MHVVKSEMGRSNFHFHFHPKIQEKKPALEGRTGNTAKLTEGLWEAVGRKLWFQCFVGKELQCCWGIFLQWLLGACRGQYKGPGGLEQEKVQFVGLRKHILERWGRDPGFKGSGEKCLSVEATATGKQKEGEVASMALSMQRRAQWAPGSSWTPSWVSPGQSGLD